MKCCEGYEECPYPSCIEQEIADRVRAEEEAQIDIFEESENEAEKSRAGAVAV